jgi:hypothetical protein
MVGSSGAWLVSGPGTGWVTSIEGESGAVGIKGRPQVWQYKFRAGLGVLQLPQMISFCSMNNFTP